MDRPTDRLLIKAMTVAVAVLVGIGASIVWMRTTDEGGRAAPPEPASVTTVAADGPAPGGASAPAASDAASSAVPPGGDRPADEPESPATDQPDPPSLVPPALGEYTYRINASDGQRSTRTSATLVVDGAATERRSTLTLGAASTSRLDRWSPTSVVRLEQTDDAGNRCRWSTPLLVLQGPLVPGSSWEATTTCDSAAGPLEWSESATVVETKTVRVGDDELTVVVIERSTTRRSPQLTETTATVEQFAPAIGLSTTTAADIRSTTRNEAGQETTSTRRLVAELVQARPRALTA